MQGNQFKIWMIGATGKFYYVDSNGKVRTTSEPVAIKYAPDGWQEKKTSWGRSVSALGLTREFSVPLKFPKDGGKILRHVRYTQGVEAYLRVVISKQDKAFGAGLIYEDWAGCEVDFSKWQDSDDFAQVELKDAGLGKFIKSRETTAVDLEYDTDAIDIRMTGIKLQSRQNYSLLASPVILSPFRKQIVPFLKTVGEGKYFNVLFQDQIGVIPDGPANEITSENLTTSDKYLSLSLAAGTEVSVTIKGGIQRTGSGPGGNIVGQEWKIETSAGQVISVGVINQLVPTSIMFSLTSPTFTLAKDERVFLYVTTLPVGGNAFWRWTDDTTVTVNTSDIYKTTTIKAYFGKDLIKKQLEKVMETDVPVQSSILQTTGPTAIAFTSGESLRGIEKAKIRTSLADFIKSLNTPEPCGFGTDIIGDKEGLVIERPEYFLNDTVIADLGEVVDFVKSNADDWMCDKIKIGYPDQEYDEVNGRDEFNVTQNRSTVITRVVKELDVVSKYRADAFGAEFARINLEGKTTTDSSSDNEVFMLLIDLLNRNSDGSYNLYRGPYQAISGVISPETIFNVPLSPTTCLHKHARRMRSMFYHYEASKMVFRTSDKNAELSYKLNGKTFTEKADITVGDMTPGPLWLPYIFSFTTQVPRNLPTLMAGNNKYGKFQFTWRGMTFKGWVLEVSQQPADNEKQTWKLLASWDNNLLNFIR
jgi:hypothetical protein